MDEQRVTIDMTLDELRVFVAGIAIQEMQAYLDREMKRLRYGNGDRQPLGLISTMPTADK